MENLDLATFFGNFPTLRLAIQEKLAWITESAVIKTIDDTSMPALYVQQNPPIAGITNYEIIGRHVGNLEFQKGSVFATLEVQDVFSRPTMLQLHHNGHMKAWLSRRTKASAKIRLLSFDGVRLRMVYRLSRANSSTVVYTQSPSLLFKLGVIGDFPRSIEMVGLEGKLQVEGTEPKRPLEETMITHGNYYERGRIGAEISYTIISNEFRVRNLILNEPARGGTDLHTHDRRVLVESRFISENSPSLLQNQIALDSAQMTRKLRHDFRRNPTAEVGYVVISYLQEGRIRSVVGELAGPR